VQPSPPLDIVRTCSGWFNRK